MPPVTLAATAATLWSLRVSAAFLPSRSVAAMPALRPIAVLLLAVVAAGCATFDEVYGVPESQDWSYFEGSPEEVAYATRDALAYTGYTVQSVSPAPGGGYLISIVGRYESERWAQIRVMPYEYEDYLSRAQTYPQGRRLPDRLRFEIENEI